MVNIQNIFKNHANQHQTIQKKKMGRGWEGGMDRVGESGGGKMKTTVFEHQEKKNGQRT